MSDGALRTLRRGFGVLAVAVREQPRTFTVAVAGSAVYAATTVAQAYVVGAVTQRVALPAIKNGHVTVGALLVTVLAVMGVAVAKVGGIIVRRLSALSMQYRLQAHYRRRMAGHYLRLPLSWHLQRSTGELLAHTSSDVEATWFAIGSLPLAVGVAVMLVITLAGLFLTDLALAVVGTVVLPVTAALTVVYARRMTPLVARVQELRGQVSSVAHESFDGSLVVKTLGREDDEERRFAGPTLALRDALVSTGRVRGFFEPLLDAVPSIGVLVLLLVGGERVAAGSLTSGQLVRSAYLFTLLAFPLRAVGWVLNELPRSVAGWDRLHGVLREELPLDEGRAELPRADGPLALRVDHLEFAFDDHPVLHDVTVEVAAGRTVALVGPTGAGKTTLATLLLGLLPPTRGRVTLDNVDVRELPTATVTDAVALVPQQTFLFDDTVRANIVLDTGASDDEVWSALRLAQADGFVAALPDGLDTTLGERAGRLSGGQRQRLALARALVRRPRLLILDDATSSLDSRVEARILAGLHDAQLPTTVVMIAHRLATLALADEVIYLDAGRVRGHGRHVDLLATDPAYRALVLAYDTRDRALEEAQA